MPHSNTKQHSLWNLSKLDSLSHEKTSNNVAIENDVVYDIKTGKTYPLVMALPSGCTDIDNTELYDDFDPDNALIFKKSPTSEQASHELQNHARVKRKHNDINESNDKINSKKNNQTATHYRVNYSSDELCEDEAKFLESAIVEEYCENMKRFKLDTNQTAAWRLGPAKYWFDLLGVPESGDGFDYGFELADIIDENEYSFDEVDEDAFLMVSQMHWEDNIIWDIDDVAQKQQEITNCKDWAPMLTKNNSAFYQGKSETIETQNHSILYSNFPVENEELVYGLWESEIIWDAKAMRKILQPKILEFDPSDENIIFAIPEDSDPTSLSENVEAQSKVKSIYVHTENIKSILSQTGVIGPSEEEDTLTEKQLNLDPFNISNDIYYMPKLTDKTSKLEANCQKHIPHSIPVLQLQASLIPTYMGPKRLRTFHRSPLKRYACGRLTQSESHAVIPLTKYISKKEKLRQEALKTGELFFMRSFADLSGRDGNLVLVEFSEEHPPLMNFIGMCSKIMNYYQGKPGKDNGPPKYKYGETAYPQNGLFLGNLAPGQSLQALENNMYRTPIYEHKVNETDFLVIRTRNHYYIRLIDALYVAGQQCPLLEVPAPNSKKIADFMKNFLQVFVYKTFSKSKSDPPKMHRDVLKKAFPTLKMPFIKKHLSSFADYNYNKGGPDCFHWVLKSTFRLPLEDEIRSLVSPEQCCAYFSMVAAQQRLKDIGYGDKSAFVLQDKDMNDEEIQNKLDDEVKAAPWNTTRAYIDAMNGKCYLQLVGPVDPTGCGEGFSYVRVPKSVFKQDEQELKSKKITGTEADLRSLSAKGAETILRSYGVRAEDLKKLTRWELIDAVRTLSTIREDRGEEGFAKFSRSKRFSMAGCQQRYKEECQRIFDLQNLKLSSSEVLSSDDDTEYLSEDLEEVEKMAENIEILLANQGKSDSLLEFEREEREREELLKMLADDESVKQKPIESKKNEAYDLNFNPHSPRSLKIHRTFRNTDGSEYIRTEIIHNSAVVDAYLQIRSTKDAAFIKQYAYEDEELELEKRKIKTQLKYIKNREMRKEKLQNQINVQTAHSHSIDSISNDVMDQLDVNKRKLVKVDGTKLKFSMKLIKEIENMNPCMLVQNTSKKKLSQKKHKSSSDNIQTVNNKHRQILAGTNRQCTDPVIMLSTIFEEIITVIRGYKEFQPFFFPVNTKSLSDYRRIISKPMDLQKINDNIRQRKYQSRVEFLSDIVQIKENCVRYNGPINPLTDSAQRMLNICVELMSKKEDKIIKLENAIKPLLDNNDQEAFSDIVSGIIKEIKAMPQAVPFLKPVNKNLVGSKDYYHIVKNPMDLDTISKKIAMHKYRRRAEILKDFQLIYDNCVLYNGQNSLMKTKAEILLKTIENHFENLSHQILHLESSIASVQEKAMRQANIDTSWQYEDDRVDIGSKFGLNNPIDLSENEFEELPMDTHCIKHNTNSLYLSEDDSDDSSTNINYIQRNDQSTGSPTIYKSSILEEDLQFSSDDDV
ncbi:transcription initiation factor TFIID subunit 1-like isoform X2 [Phymastichus coffea]|nr:transcription initiation factor TFIID subunit 1-like isoform X2 [Phymastichus coffea]XP_058793131.1 transcription initiation factor TFIID subunit 1-like isoform X2 [Phymastichus coffea]